MHLYAVLIHDQSVSSQLEICSAFSELWLDLTSSPVQLAGTYTLSISIRLKKCNYAIGALRREIVHNTQCSLATRQFHLFLVFSTYGTMMFLIKLFMDSQWLVVHVISQSCGNSALGRQALLHILIVVARTFQTMCQQKLLLSGTRLLIQIPEHFWIPSLLLSSH